MARLLVTGCAGRVGVAACTDLAAAGHEVVGLDLRLPEVHLPIDARLCDLTQEGALGAHLQGVDAVLHLAAIPVPRGGTPPQIFDLNCAGTFRLFQACTDAGVRHVVVASSINAVGYYFGTVPFELDYLPVDEDHPKTTSDAYSFSKQVTEEIGAYFARREGIASACLRFGAGLGWMDDLRQRMGEGLRSSRALVGDLLQLPDAEAAAEIRRMRDAYDTARQGRAAEGGPPADLPPHERQLMGQRHNLLSFIELGEACRAMRLALETTFQGYHTLFIVDGQNLLGLPAAALARLLWPDVTPRHELRGNASLVDPRRASALLGFDSTVSADNLWIEE